jgi:hypothetical protein
MLLFEGVKGGESSTIIQYLIELGVENSQENYDRQPEKRKSPESEVADELYRISQSMGIHVK